MGDKYSVAIAGQAPRTKLDGAQKIKLQKAVREFESIFVGYMLKSMRNTVEKADNTTEGFGTDILEGMFDVELARHISRNSSLGLAEMLYRKMTGESLPRSVPAAPAQAASKAVAAASLQPQGDANVDRAMRAERNAMTLDQRLKNVEQHIAEASQKFGVKDTLIRAVIAAESGGRPDALSAKEAKGLMQLLDSTAAELGVRNIWDPRENILGGTKYLKQLLDRFDGDVRLALASYNAGPRAVERHGGVPPYRETREYVERVLSFLSMMTQSENNDE